MAKFVSIMGMAHAPGVTGWIDACPEEDRRAIEAGYSELGRIMAEAKPDIIIGVGNDHLLNLPLVNPPHWRVDCAAEWNGPAEFFKAWLKQPGYHVTGRPEIADVVLEQARKAGHNIDRGEGLLFDDNWSVPLDTHELYQPADTGTGGLHCLRPRIAAHRSG